jgi:hypothetical protein
MNLKPFIRTNINIVNMKDHIPTEYDYYIGRPSIFGNPFSHLEDSEAKIIVDNRDISIELYKKFFYTRINNNDMILILEINKMIDIYNEYGKLNLVCWCKPKPCHGDIIKEYLEYKLSNSI